MTGADLVLSETSEAFRSRRVVRTRRALRHRIAVLIAEPTLTPEQQREFDELADRWRNTQ